MASREGIRFQEGYPMRIIFAVPPAQQEKVVSPWRSAAGGMSSSERSVGQRQGQ
jgi:hypothetical protein